MWQNYPSCPDLKVHIRRVRPIIRPIVKPIAPHCFPSFSKPDKSEAIFLVLMFWRLPEETMGAI